jgi:hypothetical protein
MWAASLSRSDIPGPIWIHQDVTVFAGETYTLTGWVYKDEPKFDRVCLRIRWRESEKLDEEDCVDVNDDEYRAITVGPTVAPADAGDTLTARIMAAADISEANPSNPVYFDDLSFTSSLELMPFYLPLVVKN